MARKIGRNDPCPCGSGKKDKKCCIATSSTHFEVSDFEWRRLRQIEGLVLNQHLIPYATQELPGDVIELALTDCLPEDLPDTLDKELLFDNFFIPWLLFNWIPFNDFGMSQFCQSQEEFHS